MDRTNARVGRRTLLSFSADVRWSPTGRPLTKKTTVLCEQYSRCMPKVPNVRDIIHRIHQVIPDCMKQCLDHRVIVPDMHPQDRMFATFCNTLRVILERTRQPLDRCAIALDVRPLDRRPLLSRPINTLSPLAHFTPFSLLNPPLRLYAASMPFRECL